MRAQCCICADLFESSAQINVVATPCGHTFHEECLLRWLKNSTTCPSCRTQVKKNKISRLFFDISEDTTEHGDVDKLFNQVGNLKAQLQETEKVKQEICDGRDTLAVLLANTDSQKEALERQVNTEKTAKEILQRDLSLQLKENAVYAKVMLDYKKVKARLQKMESVQTMLSGDESEVQATLAQYTHGGDQSVKQLCTLVTVMRREFTQTSADNKALREQISKLKSSVCQHRVHASNLRRDVTELKSQLEQTNETLSEIEKENSLNRRKITHLRKAVKFSQTDGSESFHQALNEESPNVAYTPVRNSHGVVNNSSGSSGLEEQENRTSSATPLTRGSNQAIFSPDLFESPISDAVIESDVSDSPHLSGHLRDARTAKDSSGCKLRFVNVPTATEKFQAAKMAIRKSAESEDISGLVGMNIMKKKLTGQSNSRSHIPSVITRGYDGFGGSTSFVQPLGLPRSKGIAKRPLSSKSKMIFESHTSAKQPKLSDCLSRHFSKRVILESMPSSAKTTELKLFSLPRSTSLSKAANFPSSSSTSLSAVHPEIPTLSSGNNDFVDLT